jgi:hypothetical protein
MPIWMVDRKRVGSSPSFTAAARRAVAFVDELLQPRLARRDQRDLRHGEQAVEHDERKEMAISMDVVGDRQAQPLAGAVFVQAHAPPQHQLAVLLGEARAVVFDAQTAPAFGHSGHHAHAAAGPLPGVVQQVAQQLFEVLPVQAHPDLVGHGQHRLDGPRGVHAAHELDHLLGHRAHLRAQRRGRTATVRCARARLRRTRPSIRSRRSRMPAARSGPGGRGRCAARPAAS